MSTATEEMTAVEVPLGEIEPWGNDRKEFDADELQQLARSMANNGLAQPITLRPRTDGGEGLWIVAGERRWRAALSLGWPTIKAFVRPMTDEQALSVMLIENVLRTDLNALEEGEAYRRRLRETGVTVAELAEQLGVPETRVQWRLDLLELGPVARDMVRTGQVGWATAWHMVGLDEARQAVALRALAEKNLTMSGMEQLCAALKADQNQGSMFDALQVEAFVDKAVRANVKLTAVEVTLLADRVLAAITPFLPAGTLEALTPEQQADYEQLQRVIAARTPKPKRRKK
jgi:ParB family chromosome partitioning protein